jgi:enamine deaminase RidA (YjgF/YER057c/UK114 family)
MTTFRLLSSSLVNHTGYADASIVRSNSEVVFLAGQCPLDADGRVVAPGNIAAQTKQALTNFDAVLDRCRLGAEDVTFIRVLVVATEPKDLVAAWEVVREHFGGHKPPATLQGVSVLGHPQQLVEIEGVAAREPR